VTESTLIIAFDQHAASVVAAVLLPGQRTPALHLLAPDLPTIGRFADRFRRRGPIRCCYEAGPCGFELQRFLQARQVPCDVIAPALIPRRAGVRIKTDRRDAMQLAILYRAGALTAVHVPTEHEEAARDLLRCREDIRADLLRARHRLEPLRERVVRLRCFRGMDDLTALTIAAEIGDPRRFARARQFMGFTGLVPSEHSSGTGRHQGGITKTGNAHLRRVLVEAAWHYRHRPALGHALRLRQRGAPAAAIRQAWVAQHRWHQRYRRLLGRGKRSPAVVTAVARELAGFTWAALTQ
jgi:transposase